VHIEKASGGYNTAPFADVFCLYEEDESNNKPRRSEAEY